jgi:choline dehydrogenase-like flavoprotein
VIIDYLSDAHPEDVEADLCIVGAGAAGIAIAHSFIGTSVRVCLLESGGLGAEQRNQALYEGSSAGHVDFDPGTSRMRVFGGSCNLWGGGCITLSSEDLKPRDWVPDSGWPIGYDELEPYYARALSFCQLGDIGFTEGTFTAATARPVLPFDDDKLVNQLFARSGILFGDAYREVLDEAPNILVLLHANLLELMPSQDGVRVQEATIGTLGGHRGKVRARHYVLATGGIENARLLLLSNSVVPQGLGNQRDVVGRYFMDHPSGTLGTLVAEHSHRVTAPYERLHGRNAPMAFPEIALSPDYQRSQRVLSARVHPFGVEGPLPRGIRALRELRSIKRKAAQDENAQLEALLSEALRNAPAAEVVAAPSNIGLTALKLGLGVGDIAKAVFHKLTDRPAVRNSHVELVGYFEQAPNRESRITLGQETDTLGQRKVCVDWRLTPLDHHTYRRSASLFGNELARLCNGQFELAPWLADQHTTPEVHGTAHHIGTTRMSDDPGKGVVNRDCKVHGMDNLHIAGSSVFPTGGWAFPTFTIVALSLRLADELRALLMAGII